MSRTGINYHDVSNAAAKIQGHNENPTVDRIREILGTGSKSTIARHLKDWKANNGPTANANDLPAELIAIVTGLWERIQGNANEEIKAHKEESTQAIKTVEVKLKDAHQKQVELEQEIHKLEGTVFQQTENHKELSHRLTEEQRLSAKHAGHIMSLEEHLQCQKQENTELHTLLKNIQNNLEHYQSSMQKLQQEQALTLEKQKNRFEQVISELRSQVAESSRLESALRFENERLKEQVSILEPLKNHTQVLEKTLAKKEALLNRLEEKNKEDADNTLVLTQALEAKTNAFIEAEQKTMVAYSRAKDLEKMLSQANDKISTLRHEQLFIIQEKANLEGQLKQINMAKKEKSPKTVSV